jgi:hypothetical protein
LTNSESNINKDPQGPESDILGDDFDSDGNSDVQSIKNLRVDFSKLPRTAKDKKGFRKQVTQLRATIVKAEGNKVG